MVNGGSNGHCLVSFAENAHLMFELCAILQSVSLNSIKPMMNIKFMNYICIRCHHSKSKKGGAQTQETGKRCSFVLKNKRKYRKNDMNDIRRTNIIHNVFIIMETLILLC